MSGHSITLANDGFPDEKANINWKTLLRNNDMYILWTEIQMTKFQCLLGTSYCRVYFEHLIIIIFGKQRKYWHCLKIWKVFFFHFQKLKWREKLSMWWKLNLFKPGKIQYPLVRRLNQLRIFVRFTELKSAAWSVNFWWLIPRILMIFLKNAQQITPFHYLCTMNEKIVRIVLKYFFLVVVVVSSIIGGGKFSLSLPKYTINNHCTYDFLFSSTMKIMMRNLTTNAVSFLVFSTKFVTSFSSGLLFFSPSTVVCFFFLLFLPICTSLVLCVFHKFTVFTSYRIELDFSDAWKQEENYKITIKS